MQFNQPAIATFLLGFFAFALSFNTPSVETDCCDAPRLSISGKVIDAETLSPIPNCHVYISGTTIGTVTDEEGNFKVNGLILGRHTLVISHVSYELVPVDITLIDKDDDLGEIKMKVKVQVTYSVEVSGKNDSEWNRNVKRFNKSVFGEFYDESKILIPNEYNINYMYSDIPEKLGEQEIRSKRGNAVVRGTIIAKGKGISLDEPFDLEIHNEYTGYILDYAVQDYYVGLQTEDYILGYMRFEEMTPKDAAQKEAWGKNREKAYYGSLNHFFKTLLSGQFMDEGFEVRITDLSPFDVKKRSKRKRAKVDTLSGNNIPNRFIISDTEFENIKKIEFSEFLEFEYWNEVDKKGKAQKSWLKLRDKAILVYDNGVLVDPSSVFLFGYLISEGLYEILPFDYSPDGKDQ